MSVATRQPNGRDVSRRNPTRAESDVVIAAERHQKSLYDYQSERYAVCCAITAPEMFGENKYIGNFDPRCFADLANRRVFAAIQTLQAAGRKGSDFALLMNLLSSQPGEPIDENFILGILKEAGTASSFVFYLEAVEEKYRRRCIIDMAEEARQLALNNAPLDDIAATITNQVERLKGPTTIDEQVRILNASDFANGEYATVYHVPGILAKGQPCICAAPQKSLKTSIILDLLLSLASGRRFLGRWDVNQASVLMLSGESGLATLQDCARRICHSKSVILSALSGFNISTWIPRFNIAADLKALADTIQKTKAELIAVDPAYLAMAGDVASNLFYMGEQLRGVSQLCQELGTTLVLVHHMKKGQADPYGMPELSGIAWSGFGEFARQWILLNRREAYVPGTGAHKLWFAVGGSAGHGGAWGLNVEEGHGDERFWSTEIAPTGAVFEGMEAQKAADKMARQDRIKATAEEERREKVRKALAAGPLTQTKIAETARINGNHASQAIHQLMELGDIVACKVTIAGGRTYDGFQLVVWQPDNPDNPDKQPT